MNVGVSRCEPSSILKFKIHPNLKDYLYQSVSDSLTILYEPRMTN